MRFHNFLSTIIALFLVPMTMQIALGQGFSVSPSRITFTGNPGETVSQVLTLSNSSNNPLMLSARVESFTRDSLGNKVYSTAKNQPTSNTAWLSLSSTAVTILPGESKKINISLAIPANAKNVTNSMIFFTQVKDQRQIAGTAKAIGVNILMELGVQVYYTPPGINAGELEFQAFQDRGIVNDGKTNVRRIMLKVYNKGQLNKEAFVRLELTNKETGEELKIEPATIAMLPEATQWVTFDLPVNLSGKFLAVAILDAGAAYDLKIAEKEIIYRP